MNLFHGTTHDFNEFNINCTKKDSHVGQGIYLTESIDDAIINYACVGPDLECRIADLADEIFQNSDEIIDYEIAEELAKKQLVGKSNYLLRCSIVENANLFVLGNNYVELWTIGKDDDSEPEYTKIGQALIDTAINNDIDFIQNTAGIESRIISSLCKTGMKIYNPCVQIKIVHLHESTLRNHSGWIGLHNSGDHIHFLSSIWCIPPILL